MSWEPTWIDLRVAEASHSAQIAEHGGADGVRDPARVEAAIARPQLAAQYGSPDVASLAAAYAHGDVQGHPFVDGDKRTGYAVALTFPALHGGRVTASTEEQVDAVVSPAFGAMTEESFAQWLRDHGAASDPSGLARG